MVKKYKIIREEVTHEQLNEIFDYYFSTSNDREVAFNIVETIDNAIDELSNMPERGANLRNRVDIDTDSKYIIVYNFAIVYDIKQDQVKIISILHMSRDFSRLF